MQREHSEALLTIRLALISTGTFLKTLRFLAAGPNNEEFFLTHEQEIDEAMKALSTLGQALQQQEEEGKQP